MESSVKEISWFQIILLCIGVCLVWIFLWPYPILSSLKPKAERISVFKERLYKILIIISMTSMIYFVIGKTVWKLIY
jgi:hypothetical protein